MIKLAAPHIDDEDVAAVERVLRSGQLVQGREVAAFEAEISSLTGSAHTVAVGSCTSALHLALLALDVGPGDEVIVPAFSWPATANVVAFCGATPVFADIEAKSFGMAPDALRETLRQHSRVRAIMPVHAFGAMAEIESILEQARDAGIPLIEDAACAFGTMTADRQAGRWGEMGCFSFHPRKAITTAEGGAVVTDDAEFARRLRMFRNHGIDPEASTPDFVLAGLNQRMTEIQAALGRTQLRKLDWLIAGRREMAARYDKLLAGSSLTTPKPPTPAAHVYQSYVVLVHERRATERDQIIARLREERIEASIGTHHIPLLRFYRTNFGYSKGDFPVTDSVASRAIALPLHAYLTAEDQARVAEVLRAAAD